VREPERPAWDCYSRFLAEPRGVDLEDVLAGTEKLDSKVSLSDIQSGAVCVLTSSLCNGMKTSCCKDMPCEPLGGRDTAMESRC
jgi:hypothetical protein